MTRIEYQNTVAEFLASSLNRRELMQKLLVRGMEFVVENWDIQPLSQFFTALDTIKGDDRRALITWVTHASGGYKETFGGEHMTSAADAVLSWGSDKKAFKIRKLAKDKGETQESRIARLKGALNHYRNVQWHMFCPEKVEKGYSFGLDAYLAKALQNMQHMTVKDREFLRDVCNVAQSHNRVIKGLTA